MKPTDPLSLVREKMDAFDAIGEMVPPAGWETSLFRRIENSKSKSQRYGRKLPFLALVFVLINAGVLFYISHRNSENFSSQNFEYEAFSDQFLINPIISQ